MKSMPHYSNITKDKGVLLAHFKTVKPNSRDNLLIEQHTLTYIK